MDEPLSNLDAKLRVQMRTELKRFHQDLGATVIYVTHDQLEAVTMADKMAVMSGGVLQQYDAPDRVFAQPVNTFVAGFVGSPAMSLIEAEAHEARRLHHPARRRRLGAAAVARELGARRRMASSRKVVLGARHSTIRLHAEERPGTVAGQVYTVEPTGDVTFVQVWMGGTPVIVSLDPSVPIRPDEPVWLEFDQNRIHLFDGETDHGPAPRLTAGPSHRRPTSAACPRAPSKRNT